MLERLAPVAPKVCTLLEQAEEDLLAFYRLPPGFRAAASISTPSTRSLPCAAGRTGRRSEQDAALAVASAAICETGGAVPIQSYLRRRVASWPGVA